MCEETFVSMMKGNMNMKKSKCRIAAMILSIALIVTIAVTALAEGALSTLYGTATKLLFDTDNVTLKIHADFSYNGEHFKTMDADYIQDGTNSLMKLDLQTPMKDGSILKSGFTVTANDEEVYSIEPMYNPDVFTLSYTTPSNSIMSDTAMRRTLINLGSAVVGVTEDALNGKIAAEKNADGTVYHVNLAKGDVPQLVNITGTLAAQTLAKRFFYMDYDYNEQASKNSSCVVVYEDYDATLATEYAKLYGEEMGDDFYEKMWGPHGSEDETLYARFEETHNKVYNDIELPLTQQYTEGVVLVAADGSTTYYPTMGEYIVANGQQEVHYDDLDATFQKYYQEKTGQTLTQQQLELIWQSGNEDLWDAYYTMMKEMEAQYIDLAVADGKAWAVRVLADGSTVMLYDYEAFQNAAPYSGLTVTDQIVHLMRELELDETAVDVQLDDQGRLVSAKGKVCLLVVDAVDMRNELVIEFTASAGDYGTSVVETFDPAAYGVVSWEEFIASNSEEEILSMPNGPIDTPTPETLIFNGVEYTLDLDEIGEGNG